MMKKTLIAALSLILSCMMIFSSCVSAVDNAYGATDITDVISTNGGDASGSQNQLESDIKNDNGAGNNSANNNANNSTNNNANNSANNNENTNSGSSSADNGNNSANTNSGNSSADNGNNSGNTDLGNSDNNGGNTGSGSGSTDSGNNGGNIGSGSGSTDSDNNGGNTGSGSGSTDSDNNGGNTGSGSGSTDSDNNGGNTGSGSGSTDSGNNGGNTGSGSGSTDSDNNGGNTGSGSSGNTENGGSGTSTPEAGKTTVSAEIVNKNGAKGVLTLISDDGDQRTADFFYTKVSPKYSSFKITIALPTSKVATVYKTSGGKDYVFNSSGGYSVTMVTNEYNTAISGSVFKKSSYATVKDFWKKIVDKGTIQIASHSHTHGPWPATNDVVYENGSVIWPKGTPTMEIRASAQIIRNALGQETPFIMRPGGSFMTTEVSTYFKSLVASDSTYLGMRSSNGAPPFKGATSAGGAKLNTVAKFKTQEGRLTIATLLVRGYEAAFNSSGTAFVTNKDSSKSTVLNAGISAWKQYVDYAMQFGQWGSIAFHSVVADSDTAEGYEVYDSQVMALMNYVQPLVDSGDLWLAHFADAAKYYFEWSSASVSASLENNCIEVSLTDNETDSRFDEALTVKVAVPSDWQTAKLTTAGNTTTLTIHTDSDGSHFVYANIVPSDSISTIKPN